MVFVQNAVKHSRGVRQCQREHLFVWQKEREADKRVKRDDECVSSERLFAFTHISRLSLSLLLYLLTSFLLPPVFPPSLSGVAEPGRLSSGQ